MLLTSRIITMALLFQIVVLVLNSIYLINVNSIAIPPASPSLNTQQVRDLWKRPGCHKVGHTRTISIAGCDEFDLTTNACRGFCLSYSIPTPEDIGPAPRSEDDGGATVNSDRQIQLSHGQAISRSTRQLHTSKVNDNNNNNNNYNSSSIRFQNLDTLRVLLGSEHSEPILSLSNKPNIKDTTNTGITPTLLSQQSHHQQQQLSDSSHSDNTNDHINTQSMSYTANKRDLDLIKTNHTPTGPKQEIISVGQCCNMVETENITLTIDCKKGKKVLKFESAKSCECFFCKNI